MTFNDETNAQRVDAALNGQPTDSHPDDAPYVRMAKALKEHASWKEEGDGMDPDVMKTQKEHLMLMAKNLKEHHMNKAKQEEKVKTPVRRPWYIWAGGAAVVTAAVMLLFVTQSGNIPFKKLNKSFQTAGSALSLVIPQANAADAFSMLVEREDKSGAETDTSFRIKSKVSVDESILKQSLKVVKVSDKGEVPVAYAIKSAGQNEFDIKPESDLETGSVYKLVIETAVDEGNGAYKQRDFSWAVQTKDVFRVIRTVPGNTNLSVPLDTAIEAMMSQTGWTDPEKYFEITPKVSGKFETHGRTLVFLPSKPLAPKTLYTVTFKKGWGIDGGPQLGDDSIVRFQTAEKEGASNEYFMPASYLMESAPGVEPFIRLWSQYDQGEVNVTGFRVSFDEAKSALDELAKQPIWMDQSDEQKRIISGLAKTQTFNQKANIERTKDYETGVRLSNAIAPGIYAVKIEKEQSIVWTILQVTNISAFLTADNDKILVWTVNTETDEPLETTVASNGTEVKTDTTGIARIDAPAEWKNADEDGASVVVAITSGTSNLLAVIFRNTQFIPYGTRIDDQKAAATWSYLFSDRPLYRSEDKINFFGFIKNRDNAQSVAQPEIRLENYSFLDFGTNENKVFASAPLNLDAAGFYNGELAWKGALSPGYYNLSLFVEGKSILTRTIEIRDVIKPAYSIQLLQDKKNIYAGEKAEGTISAKFFDGTPVSKTKLKLRASGGFRNDMEEKEVVVDDMGMARFSFDTIKPNCDLQSSYPYCAVSEPLTLTVTPAVGEEGEITSTVNYQVWRRSYLETTKQGIEGNKASLEYRVRKVVVDQANGKDEESVFGGGVSGASIKFRVLELHWEKTQVGTQYDPVEKKAVPQYRYDEKQVEILSQQKNADGEGKLRLDFDVKDGFSYRVMAWVEDNGPQHLVTSYLSKGWYGRGDDNYPTLSPTSMEENKNGYKVGEKIALSMKRAGKPMPSEKASYLFIHAARGLRSWQAVGNPDHEFEFTDEYAPNMTVYGIVFENDAFVSTQFSASYDYSERELNVAIESDKKEYAPGSQAGFKITVKDKNGNPVPDAMASVTIADEALLAVAQLDMQEQPLDSIYRWQSDGIVGTSMSHNSAKAMMGGGGAEMGGGARDAVRRNFKDQAAFMVIRTGADGTATGSFSLPDNITSWRLTAVAAKSDLRAGSARLNVPATKPVFVEAVVPSEMLVSDKPVIKLRAFGTGLPKEGELTYRLDVPGLGISNQEVKGQINKPVYLAVEKPVAGLHKATITLSEGGNVKDAIEKNIRFVTSRATHDERVSIELAPGTELPDVGQSREIEAMFESKAMSAYRSKVEMLARPWSARLESAVAGRIAKALLRSYFPQSEVSDDEIAIAQYQRPSGGLGILPYSSEDVALSSKIAAVNPEGLDYSLLSNYFWNITDDKNVSLEESIQALAGLAALGQPVINRLRTVSEAGDLTWRENLALIRGLDAIGDREEARARLDNILSNAKEQDGLMSLQVSEKQAEIIEATSEAAAIAAAVSHPSAEKLAKFVDTAWNNEVMTDLDRAMYMQKVVPTLSRGNVKISYAIGEQVTGIELGDEPVKSVKLTAEEAKAFRVVSVNGPAAVSFVKRGEGDVVGTSDALRVTREYMKDGKPVVDLHEGDTVNIVLKASFEDKAQEGCYVLRDRLPAGMMPIVNIGFDRYKESPLYYPFDSSSGEASFVVCKDKEAVTINYLARVVSLGTYTAGGALLQSMVAPSVATVSAPASFEIK